MGEQDWLEEIRGRIFNGASSCTVSLHQSRVMFREIADLRAALAARATDRAELEALRAAAKRAARTLYQIAHEKRTDDAHSINAHIEHVRLSSAILEAERPARLIDAAQDRPAAAPAPQLTVNDWAVLYRLIDRYTEAAYQDVPDEGDPSHATRQAVRERVSRNLIAAREATAPAERREGE